MIILNIEMFDTEEKPTEGSRVIVCSEFGIIEGRYILGKFMNIYMDSEIPHVNFWGYWPNEKNINVDD